MKAQGRLHYRIVAALLLLFLAGAPVLAQDAAKLDDLYTRLAASEDAGEAGRIEAEIRIERAKSGSPSMDLLLQRGQDAMELGNVAAAIDHFSALVDHAPDFTEGHFARAAAYYMGGEIGPALADLGMVLTADPRNFDALGMLGLLLEESDKPAKALEALRAAQAIHPHMPDINDAIDRLAKTLEGQEL
jgi:tetratricopeptide (TPR) repeat protein